MNYAHRISKEIFQGPSNNNTNYYTRPLNDLAHKRFYHRWNMKKEFNWVETIFRWYVIIMGIIAIFMLVQKILGLSPAIQEVTVTLIGILTGLVINLHQKFGRVDEFMSTSKRTFLKIGVDIRDMRKDITELKIDVVGLKKDMDKEFSNVKKDISIIKKDMSILKKAVI